jgi:hypothetical protein
MGGDAAKRRGTWLFGAALFAMILAALRGREMDARAGTQQCNTECQSKMTDCILACDGMRSCEEACKKKGQSCVNACTDGGSETPPLPDGAVDAPPVPEIADARSNAAKDGSRRATRDR